MDVLRYHWYDLGVLSGLAMILYYQSNKRTLSTPQKLLILNFLALIWHQFEEYRFPGGFPAVMNMAVQESSMPDRYPLNANSAMVTNVIATYGLYLPVIFLPRVGWLGLASVLFGFGQVGVHGVMVNKQLGGIYNPGVLSTMCGFVPVGMMYIRYMQRNGLLEARDWVLGVLTTGAIGYVLLIKATFSWMPDYGTEYPFTAEEMGRWGARLAGLA